MCPCVYVVITLCGVCLNGSVVNVPKMSIDWRNLVVFMYVKYDNKDVIKSNKNVVFSMEYRVVVYNLCIEYGGIKRDLCYSDKPCPRKIQEEGYLGVQCYILQDMICIESSRGKRIHREILCKSPFVGYNLFHIVAYQ